MGNSKKTAAVVGTGFIGPVHVEALRRIGIDVASLALDSEYPNDLWIGYRDKPNELLIRDTSLLAPEVKAFASYPGGHNEGFPDTFKQLYRAIYDYLAEEDYSRPKLFANFVDGPPGNGALRGDPEESPSERWVRVTNGGPI
jgi:hypothetical protein